MSSLARRPFGRLRSKSKPTARDSEQEVIDMSDHHQLWSDKLQMLITKCRVNPGYFEQHVVESDLSIMELFDYPEGYHRLMNRLPSSDLLSFQDYTCSLLEEGHLVWSLETDKTVMNDGRFVSEE